MRTVRFLTDRTEQRPGGQTFIAGSVHQLRDDSALHWVKRVAAVYVEMPIVDAPVFEPVSELPPDPIVNLSVEPLLPDPPAVLAPLLEASEKAKDGDSVGSATADVAGQDGAGPGLGAEPAVVAPAGTPSGRRSSVRRGSGQ